MKQEIYYDQFGREVMHSCHYCDHRHGGCPADDKTQEETWEKHNCPHFEVGKCFKCVIHKTGTQEDWNNLCDDVFFPCGCNNFKK